MVVDELVGLLFFDRLPEWTLERLARSAAKRWCEPNTLVARQNDEARAVYFLLSGAVQVLVYFEGLGDLLMGVQRNPGSLAAGSSAFRPPYRYTASARCEEPASSFGSRASPSRTYSRRIRTWVTKY